MTHLEHLVFSLQLFLAVVIGGVLWFRWRIYRIDSLRQKLFALRSELFDYAANGHVQFDRKAYTLLRLKINGMIRFAHRVSFARLFMSLVFFHSSRTDFLPKILKEWQEAVNQVPSEVREKLLEMDQKMSVILVQHMVTGSPVLVLILGAFVALALVSAVAMHLWEGVSRHMPGLELLEAQAMQAEAA